MSWVDIVRMSVLEMGKLSHRAVKPLAWGPQLVSDNYAGVETSGPRPCAFLFSSFFLSLFFFFNLF